MGLFDKLKKAVDDIAAEAGKNKDDLQKEIEKVLGPRPQQTQPYSDSGRTVDYPAANVHNACAIYPESTDQTQRVYDIICRNFPELQVQCHVPMIALMPTAHPKCMPITYLLLQNNAPRAAIILMHQKQHSGIPVKASDSACASLGIRYIHLYHEYENAEAYVVGRIREAL